MSGYMTLEASAEVEVCIDDILDFIKDYADEEDLSAIRNTVLSTHTESAPVIKSLAEDMILGRLVKLVDKINFKKLEEIEGMVS